MLVENSYGIGLYNFTKRVIKVVGFKKKRDTTWANDDLVWSSQSFNKTGEAMLIFRDEPVLLVRGNRSLY